VNSMEKDRWMKDNNSSKIKATIGKNGAEL
jgi:hypothetical protein